MGFTLPYNLSVSIIFVRLRVILYFYFTFSLIWDKVFWINIYTNSTSKALGKIGLMIPSKNMTYLVVWLLIYHWLFSTPWDIAQQASLSVGFSRQKHCNCMPFPFPRDLSDQRIEPVSPALAGRFFTTELSGSPTYLVLHCKTDSTPHCMSGRKSQNKLYITYFWSSPWMSCGHLILKT